MSANRQAALESETSERDVTKPKEKLEYVEIGPLLRDLRGDLSLRQLEEETGIAYSYLSVIERGNKRPGPRVLSRLAAYHDVPLDELLGAARLPAAAERGRKSHHRGHPAQLPLPGGGPGTGRIPEAVRGRSNRPEAVCHPTL